MLTLFGHPRSRQIDTECGMSESAVQSEARGWRALLRPAVLDRAEQAVIVVLFCLLTWRVFDSDNPLALLLLLSEFAVVCFVLIRRPTSAISVRLGDWLLATGDWLLATAFHFTGTVSDTVVGGRHRRLVHAW